MRLAGTPSHPSYPLHRRGGYISTYTSAERYDPATGFWTVTGSLNNGRIGHTANLLDNGLVLVAGGWVYRNPGDALASAELYDPGIQ